MSNFTTAIEATETAMNSTGSALNENAKYLDSIEGKVANFQSAFEELSSSIVDSELIKTIIELGTALLKVANNDTVQFIAKTGILFSVFKLAPGIILPFITNIKKLFTSFTSGIMTMKQYELSLSSVINRSKLLSIQEKMNTMTLKELKVALQGAGVATDGLTTKKKAQEVVNKTLMASTLLLNVALAATSFLIMAAISIYQKQQQAREDATRAVIEESEALQNQKATLESEIDTIRELNDTLYSNSSTYDEVLSSKEQLIAIQESLIEQYGLEKDGLDLVTGSIEEQIKKLRELQQQESQDYVNDNRPAYEDAHDEVYGENYYSRNMDIGFGNMSNMRTSGSLEDSNINFYMHGDIANASEEYKQKAAYFQEYYDDYKEIMNKYGEIKEVEDNSSGGYFDVSFETANVEQSKKALEEWYQYLIDNEDKMISSGVFSEDQYVDALSYAKTQLDNIESSFGDSYTAIEQYQKELLNAAGFESFVEDLEDLGNSEALTVDNIENLLKSYPDLQAAMDLNGITIRKLVADYGNVDNQMEKFNTDLQNMLKQDPAAETYIQGVLDNFVAVGDTSEDAIKKLIADLPTLEASLSNYGLTIDDFIAHLVDIHPHLQTTQNIVLETAKTFGEINESIDNIQDAYDKLSSAQEEYNTNGYLSVDTVQELLAMDSKYLAMLDTTNGQLNLNRDSLLNMAHAELDAAEAAATVAYAEQLQTIALGSATTATKEQKDEYEALIQTYQDSQAIIDKTAGQITKFKATIAASGNEDAINLAAEAEKAYNNSIFIINSARDNLGSAIDSATSSSSGSSTPWWETELDRLKEMFDYNEITIEEYIAGVSDVLGKLEKGSDEWREVNDLLQDLKLDNIESDFDRGLISLEEYIKALKVLQDEYKYATEAWLDLAEKIKDANIDLANETKDAYDDAKDAIDSLIDAEIDKIDEKIEALEKANDETEREIELARLQEALENAKNNKTKRVWNGSAWVWEVDQTAIDEAQQELDDFELESQIEDLEAEKDALEELKQQYEDITNAAEEAQKKQELINMMGAEAEKEILNDRIAALEEFKNKYNAIQDEIKGYEDGSLLDQDTTTPDTTTSGDTSSGSSPTGSSSSTHTVQSGETLSGIASKYGLSWRDIYEANKSVIGSNPNLIKPGQNFTIPGYANGGIVDYTGLAMLHGTPNKPEVVMNYDQIKTFMENVTQPQVASAQNNGNSETNYNFYGDFKLPNVNNAKQFLNELKNQVNITKQSI